MTFLYKRVIAQKVGGKMVGKIRWAVGKIGSQESGVNIKQVERKIEWIHTL